MAKEIERKFLVKSTEFKANAIEVIDIKQSYLSQNPDVTIRVRLWNHKGFLTVKSRNHGATRGEWEYEIPEGDACEMAELAGGWAIEKYRYIVPFSRHNWEVDQFHYPHHGLLLAEVELQDENEPIELPTWVGQEVTSDPRYYNSNLALQG